MNRHLRNGLTLLALAAAAGVALRLCGRGPLATPPSWQPRTWPGLVADRGPVATAMTIARLAGLVASAYLALVGALTAVAHASGLGALRALAAAITPRVLRPLLGLATVLTFAVPNVAGAAETAPPPTMVLVTTTTVGSAAPPTTAPSTAPPTTAPPSAPPTMRRVAPSTTTTTTTSPAPAPTTTSPPTTAPARSATAATRVAAAGTAAAAESNASAPTTPSTPTPATSATWTVQRGDHLWHIAEATLRDATGHPPTERETDTYWRALVAANRDRLVDADNPDLIFRGQDIVLPPIR